MSGSQIAVALSAVVLMVAGLLFWVTRAKLEKDITVAVVAAAGTILASVLVVSFTQYNTKQMEVNEAHRLKKIEVYSEFGDLVFSIFQMTKIPNRKDLSDEEKTQALKEAQGKLEESYSSFSKKLLLWGSPEVINGWLIFTARSRSVDAEAGGEEAVRGAIMNLLYMDDVFRSMRDDLELSNRGLKEGDLVKAFLQDPEILDPFIGSRRGR
jgi:hypothetical protein